MKSPKLTEKSRAYNPDTDKLLVEVRQGMKTECIDVEQYLHYAGIESKDVISSLNTSTFFPPIKYPNTGRTNRMPQTYLCMGSVSYEFRLKDGTDRAISLAFYHDTTMHRGSSEVNCLLQGWPVGIAEPDNTKNVPCHSLRDDLPVELTIAKRTTIEKKSKIPPPSV